jgi:hypothetical protein
MDAGGQAAVEAIFMDDRKEKRDAAERTVPR